jgi:hypothetical protein
MTTNELYGVSVQNRFEFLQERESENLKMDRSSDITRQNFVESSYDDKLIHIFDELRFVRNEQAESCRGIMALHRSVENIGIKVNQVIDNTNNQTEFMKTLAYKSIDIEARSRRNNLIFRGIVENVGENCPNIIRNFLENNLDIDSRDVYISRAHRIGAKDRMKRYQSRPIVVNFRDYCDTEYILSKAKLLKDTPFSISVDLPREIQQARSRLWPRYKQCKQENPRSKVTIVYPAKLIQDGRLVHDEMPEWQRYINASRLSSIEHIGRLNDQITSQLAEPSYQSQHDPQNGKGPEHMDTIAFSQQQTGDVMQRQYNTCDLPALNDSFNGPQYSIPLSSQKEQNPISQMNSTCGNTVNNSTCPNTIHSQPMYSHDNPNVHQSESHTNQNNNKSQSHQTTNNNNSENSAQSQSDMPAVYFNLDTQSVETYASVTSPKYGAVTSRSSITNNNTPVNSGDKRVLPERGRARNIRAASRSEKRVESASPYRRQNRISPVSINRNDSTSKNDKQLGQ